MLKKRRSASSQGYHAIEGKGSLTSGNFRSSLSSMFLPDDRSVMTRIGAKRSTREASRKTMPPIVAEHSAKNFDSLGIPDNVAVHFGNFYCVERKSRNNGTPGTDGRTGRNVLPARDSPRSEFTGQMVHKLERLVGTEHYAHQISALLEEIAESPDYVVKQPLPDDNFPHESFDIPNYPLWYKEPDKISYRSPSNESSRKIERGERNDKRNETQRCESATSSECTPINAMSKSDSEEICDIADRDNNYESSASATEITLGSIDTTKDDTDSEESKINVFLAR